MNVYMIVEMRHKGIKELRVTIDWSHEEVAEAMLPDQSEWLGLWVRKVAEDSLKGLIKKLEYREPLEMLSCFACILGDSALDKFSLECLSKGAAAISIKRKQVQKSNPMRQEGNPAWIVMQALRGEP